MKTALATICVAVALAANPAAGIGVSARKIAYAESRLPQWGDTWDYYKYPTTYMGGGILRNSYPGQHPRPGNGWVYLRDPRPRMEGTVSYPYLGQRLRRRVFFPSEKAMLEKELDEELNKWREIAKK